MQNPSELLGSDLVYPGHPMVVMYLLVNAYDSFEDAIAHPTVAQELQDLPLHINAAPACIRAAIDLLKHLYDRTLGFKEAEVVAGTYWLSEVAQQPGFAPAKQGLAAQGEAQYRAIALSLMEDLQGKWTGPLRLSPADDFVLDLCQTVFPGLTWEMIQLAGEPHPRGCRALLGGDFIRLHVRTHSCVIQWRDLSFGGWDYLPAATVLRQLRDHLDDQISTLGAALGKQ